MKKPARQPAQPVRTSAPSLQPTDTIRSFFATIASMSDKRAPRASASRQPKAKQA